MAWGYGYPGYYYGGSWILWVLLLLVLLYAFYPRYGLK